MAAGSAPILIRDTTAHVTATATPDSLLWRVTAAGRAPMSAGRALSPSPQAAEVWTRSVCAAAAIRASCKAHALSDCSVPPFAAVRCRPRLMLSSERPQEPAP